MRALHEARPLPAVTRKTPMRAEVAMFSLIAA